MPKNSNKITPENLEPIIGLEAIKLSGMQEDLAHQLARQNAAFGTMLTLRVSGFDNIPPYNSPGVPKPSSIHSKTSPLVWGYIPIDPIFTRAKSSKDRSPSGHHHGDNVDNQESVQLKLTLYEILKRCVLEEDLQVNFKKAPVLIFKFKKGKAPRIPRHGILKYTNKDFEGEFSIRLDDENAQTVKRLFTRSSDDPTQDSFLIAERVEELLKKKSVGMFNQNNSRFHSKLINDLTDKEYPIFYKNNSKDKYSQAKPLLVFAKDGQPIMGDWDKDFESIPVNTELGNVINSIYNNAHYAFNTFDGIEEQRELLRTTESLFNSLRNYFNERESQYSPEIKKFFSMKNKFLQMVDYSLLERAGVITSYEFLKNMLSNYCYKINSKTEGYFDNPFQHGPDNRNPYAPSPDGPRLHIYNGEFIYTKNEEQQINLYLNNDFLKTNFIDVHPLVNMQRWYRVIVTQIEFGQGELILPETITAYFKYIKANNLNPVPVVNMEKWHAVIKTQIDNQQQRFIPDHIMRSYENYINSIIDNRSVSQNTRSSSLSGSVSVSVEVSPKNTSNQSTSTESSNPLKVPRRQSSIVFTPKQDFEPKTSSQDDEFNNPLNNNIINQPKKYD